MHLYWAVCLSIPCKHAHAGLLEKKHDAQKISLSHGLQADADWSNLTSSVAGDDQQRITLTVLPNQVLVKTIPDVGRMPFTEFASLYAVSLLCLQLTVHVTQQCCC